MRLFTLSLLILGASTAFAGSAPVSLDSCRNMALRNNKELRMSRENIEKARYQHKAARAAYFPGVDFTGAYLYNQKKLSIFDSDQRLPTQTFNPATGKYEFNLVTNPATGEPLVVDGQPVPSTIALIPKSAMEYDIHNVFFGAVTITQPIYMGGKIRAMNTVTHYAEALAQSLHDNDAEEVVYNVDAAYWQVVSLKAKHELATSYVALLDTLRNNVEAMIEQGVATRSDLLSVEVKLNQANVDLTKVDNGLVLSRMALAQICGLPIDTQMTLCDEDLEYTGQGIGEAASTTYSIDDVYARRPDLRALETGVKITEALADAERASMLPSLALVGTYTFSNPNMFNGFKKRFNGMFSVGAMLTVPLWHWGGNYYRYRAAKSDAIVAQMKVENARELIDLQVSQARFKASEAVKTYASTTANLSKASENLRQASLGFREGVMTTDNVMEAQTAWLKANSENIDALIDVHLCDVYLAKTLGILPTE